MADGIGVLRCGLKVIGDVSNAAFITSLRYLNGISEISEQERLAASGEVKQA